jgi:hypothetical protein
MMASASVTAHLLGSYSVLAALCFPSLGRGVNDSAKRNFRSLNDSTRRTAVLVLID